MRDWDIDNPRFPHTIKIVRVNKSQYADPDDPLEESDVEVTEKEAVLYEGEGRSYTDTTTTGTEKVDINRRKASIPVRYNVWEAGKQPLDGDTIEVTIGNNSETGVVRDCEPDNNRTVIYWDYVRV